VLDLRPFPFRVVHAEGARLTDADGFEYVDLLGDYTAGLAGHHPDTIAAALTATLRRGWNYGAMHSDEIRFAELVVDRFPAIEQVRFTNSGTEANLMAIQLARHSTGRHRILVFRGGYHGGLLYFGAGGEALQAPFPYAFADYNDLASVTTEFDVHDDIAAILVEPMMGSGGCIPAEPGFLAGLRSLADTHAALLIFDEVMTSRMSPGGAQLRLGVHPDLTALGKYLAGGMTFGAFGGRADLMAAFDPARGGTLTHGGTYNNNVLTMAGGVAALTEVITPQALDGVFTLGESLRARVAQVVADAPIPMCVTGWGSMMNLHTVAGPVRSPADLATTDAGAKEVLFHELLERGIYTAPRGLIALSFAVTVSDADRFVEALSESVATFAP
jgi:glutamate-1-semialdehyde 2,1-aminomutase